MFYLFMYLFIHFFLFIHQSFRLDTDMTGNIFAT